MIKCSICMAFYVHGAAASELRQARSGDRRELVYAFGDTAVPGGNRPGTRYANRCRFLLRN